MKLTTLLLAATALAAGNTLTAQNLLLNGDFEATPFSDGWLLSAGVVQFGGFAPNSIQAAALVGTGQRIGQNFATRGPDWYLDAYIAIRDAGANRALSLMVNQAANGDNVNAATINLRYQSGQFNAFAAGSFGSDLGLGTMAFSVDANADGDLNDPEDTRNVYRIRLTGHGWGTTNANYDIELSNANETNFTRRVNGLTRYQNSSGVAGTPQSFVFNTAFGNNPGFWVDDASYGLIELPDDPNLELGLTGDLFGVLPVDSPAVTRLLTVRNTGMFEDLILTNAIVTGADSNRYTVLTPFPVTIFAGQQADIEIAFDPQTDSRQFSATLLLECNDPSTPVFNVNLNATRLVTGAQMLANPDFEATPFDTGWVTGTNVIRQGGFAPGSINAVRLVGEGQRVGQNLVCSSNWFLEAYFAVNDPAAGTNETFSIYVTTISDIFNTGASRLRLRYQNGQFFTGNTPLPDLGALLPSVDANADGDLDDAGDTRNVYRLRITGRGWGAASSTADVELSDPNSSALDRVVAGLAVNSAGGTPTSFAFDTLFGGNAGFWVDDTRLTIGLPAPRQPRIRGFSTSQDGFTISWTSETGANYRLLYSTDLTNWVDSLWAPIPSQGASTSFTEFLPGDPKAFFKIRKD